MNFKGVKLPQEAREIFIKAKEDKTVRAQYANFIDAVNNLEKIKERFPFINWVVERFTGKPKIKIENQFEEVLCGNDLHAKMLTEKPTVLKYDWARIDDNSNAQYNIKKMKEVGYEVTEYIPSSIGEGRYYMHKQRPIKSAQYAIYDSQSDKPLKVITVTGQGCYNKALDKVESINKAMEEGSVDAYIELGEYFNDLEAKKAQRLRNIDMEDVGINADRYSAEELEFKTKLETETSVLKRELEEKLDLVRKAYNEQEIALKIQINEEKRRLAELQVKNEVEKNRIADLLNSLQDQNNSLKNIENWGLGKRILYMICPKKVFGMFVKSHADVQSEIVSQRQLQRNYDKMMELET